MKSSTKQKKFGEMKILSFTHITYFLLKNNVADHFLKIYIFLYISQKHRCLKQTGQVNGGRTVIFNSERVASLIKRPIFICHVGLEMVWLVAASAS